MLGGVRPIWTGQGFELNGRRLPVLSFSGEGAGWTDGLTTFHEEEAGAGTHPIDVASRRRARAALRRHLSPSSDAPVLLEVGCSSGFLLPELVSDWPGSLVMGSDVVPGPLDSLARKLPALPLLQFDLVQCPLPSASVDAVVLLNVLEHVEQDGQAVAQIARVLKPGGIAVVEVPAGPGLYDVYDRYLRHFRRYRLRDLASLLRNAGLALLEESHLGFLVYPAFALVKRRNRRYLDAPEDVQREKVASSITRSGGGSGGPALRWAMAIEEWLSNRMRFPFGIRCVAVARKPG
jgi:SAM-dependent methyltransferase